MFGRGNQEDTRVFWREQLCDAMGVCCRRHSRRVQNDLIFFNACLEPKLTRPISFLWVTREDELRLGESHRE